MKSKIKVKFLPVYVVDDNGEFSCCIRLSLPSYKDGTALVPSLTAPNVLVFGELLRPSWGFRDNYRRNRRITLTDKCLDKLKADVQQKISKTLTVLRAVVAANDLPCWEGEYLNLSLKLSVSSEFVQKDNTFQTTITIKSPEVNTCVVDIFGEYGLKQALIEWLAEDKVRNKETVLTHEDPNKLKLEVEGFVERCLGTVRKLQAKEILPEDTEQEYPL